MDTKSVSLNDKLAHASKKFYKSCEQIKLVKQRISELINVFTYCDQEMMTTSQQQQQQSRQNLPLFYNQPRGDEGNNDNYLIRNEHNYMSQAAGHHHYHHHHHQQQQQQPATHEQQVARLNLEQRNSHLNIFKESLRQQIENLQCIKTAYFMYAHRKADEITKLQCELYGEDAVREAYELAEPDVLLPAAEEMHPAATSSSTMDAPNRENANLGQTAMETFLMTSNADFEMDIATTTTTTSHSQSDSSSSWTPWNFNRYHSNTNNGIFSSLISTTTTTSQQESSSSSSSSSSASSSQQENQF